MNFTPVNDFFTNIKDKLTSPFFGTLIFVWCLRNWDLVYSFFNFDSKTQLSQKLKYFNNYISNKNFLTELALNISYSLILLALGYLLITITKAISAFFDTTALSWVTNIVSKGKVVSKDLFEEAVKERGEYSEKYEIERKKVRNYSKEYDEIDADNKNQREQNRLDVERIRTLETQANNFASDINSKSEEIHRLKLINTSFENEVESLKERVTNLKSDIDFQKNVLIESEKERQKLLNDSEIASSKYSQQLADLQLSHSETIQNYENSISMLQSSVSGLQTQNTELKNENTQMKTYKDIALKNISDFLINRVANDIRKYGHRTDKYLMIAADLDIIETYDEIGTPKYLHTNLEPIDDNTAFGYMYGREVIREISLGENTGQIFSNKEYRTPDFFKI